MSEDIVSLFESSSEQVAESSETSEVSETVENETVEKESSETETKETEASETDDKESKETKVEPTSTEEDNEKQKWTFHAVKDERQKRQKAETELEELKSKLKGDDKQEMPDIFEDQEGFVKSMESNHKDEIFRTKVEIYREVMIESHKDYIEKEAEFIKLAKENPILLAKFTNATNPAKFAYEQMTKFNQFNEMQDIETFKDKIRAELKLELENELKEGESEKAEKTGKLSPSLAKARGSTDKAEKVSDNPSDLFD